MTTVLPVVPSNTLLNSRRQQSCHGALFVHRLAGQSDMTTENRAVYDVALQREVAELIVEALNLEMTADEIKPDEPLYGEGLGLDSIDVLEIALVVSKR